MGTRALVLGLLLAGCGGSVIGVPTPSPLTDSPSPAAGRTPSPTAVPIPLIRQSMDRFLSETGRAALAIFVYADPAAGVGAAHAVTLMQSALDLLVARTGGYTSYPVTPVAECPFVPYFLRTASTHPKVYRSDAPDVPFPFVERPSPYRLAIVVTARHRIDYIFADGYFRRGGEEVLCDPARHDCGEVTTAFYLDPIELADPAMREDALLRGLGILPPPDR